MKGVAKIKWSGKGKVDPTKSKPNISLCVLGKNDIGFVVDKWLSGTTEEQKKKNVIWILQDSNRKEIKRIQKTVKEEFTINIPNALCGPYKYYLEASLFGGIDFKNNVGLYINGYCTPKIISCKWEASSGSSVMLSYGTQLDLNIQTEGLNGYKNLILEVYRKQDNRLIHTEPKVGVIDGEINHKITNTLIWQAKIYDIAKQEIFYIKLKNPTSNKYLTDNSNSVQLFPYLTINNVLNFVPPVASSNNTALKVGDTEKKYSTPIACKYPLINIASAGESRTIFDENTKKIVTINYPIIASDFVNHRQNVSINLKGVKTNQCINSGNINSHINNTIVIVSKPENFIIKSKSQDILDLDTGFMYHPSNDNFAEKSAYNILEYIWPVNLPTDNSKPLKIKTSTCAYTNYINILIYPDVKWTLDFRFGMKGPEQYSHTGLPTYDRNESGEKVNSRYSKAQEKAMKAGRVNTYGLAKKVNGMELEFQLNLKAEYNKGEELELASKYSDKIKKFLNLLLSLKEGLDTLTNIEKVNSGHKSAIKGISNKLFKAPIVGSIDYPAISFGSKWQCAVSKDNTAFIDGKLMARFHPLLKGDVSLDIIAAVSYVPAFGQAVKAIEIALSTAGAELNFMLTIFGQVNVEGEYVLSDKGGSNLNVNGELGIKLVLSGKVKINLNLIIFKVDGEIQAEGYVVTSIKPKLLVGNDIDGTYLEGKCDFMGINMVCVVTAVRGRKTYQYKDTYNIIERRDKFWSTGKNYIIK